LVTVAILGIAVITIVAAMGTALRASDIHRKQARVETLLRNYAEAVTDPAVAYVDCAGPGAYASPPGFSAPGGYSVSITAVSYWNGDNPATFGGACSSPDTGIQRLTISAQSSDGRGSKTLGFVKRRCAVSSPCGT
jgi:hypothetical protein